MKRYVEDMMRWQLLPIAQTCAMLSRKARAWLQAFVREYEKFPMFCKGAGRTATADLTEFDDAQCVTCQTILRLCIPGNMVTAMES